MALLPLVLFSISSSVAAPLSGCIRPSPLSGYFLHEPLSERISPNYLVAPALPVSRGLTREQLGTGRLVPHKLAAGLLPRSSRWLLTARTREDGPVTVETILREPRTMGTPVRRSRRPFGLLHGTEHVEAALLFLAGTALFLTSVVLGTAHASPLDPVLPPKPASRQAPLLPALVASPRAAIRGATVS